MIEKKENLIENILFGLLGLVLAYMSNLFRMAIIVIVGENYGMESLLWVHANLGPWIFLLWSLIFWHIYFYATSIFKQTGIGTDAAFSSGVLLSFTTVIFTLIAIYLVDRVGRRPLLLIGMTGIAISLLTCAYGFNQAKYKLSNEGILSLTEINSEKLLIFQDIEYDSDVKFKKDIKSAIGNQVYAKNEGSILEAAIEMNSTLVLLGILGFIACFAFSLGPIMWVMLSELFPNKFRGLAIGVIGFVNSFASWTIQQIFPWELSNLGSALTFLIYGLIALAGVLLFLKILPETKGKSLEEIELEFVK